jgi:hypothetical protein
MHISYLEIYENPGKDTGLVPTVKIQIKIRNIEYRFMIGIGEFSWKNKRDSL